MTGNLVQNITEPDDQVVSGITDILEHIAQPNSTKSVDKEGKFFFDIINSMMDFNASSLNTKVGNQSQQSSSRLVIGILGICSVQNFTFHSITSS